MCQQTCCNVSNVRCCQQKSDYLVCTCMGVMYSDICQAISAGCKDFQSLSEKLGVGTGCSSCVDEVQDILTQELKNSKN